MIGNLPIQRFIREAKNIGHALLFAGPSGVGKGLFARTLAERLLGRPNHPDLHIFYPEGKAAMHPIDRLRELSSQVYLTPLEGPNKVFIIEHAHRMLPSSANALLKTFEEPAPNTTLILLTDHHEEILSTILSRSQTLFFQPLSRNSRLDPLLLRALKGENCIQDLSAQLEKRQKELYLQNKKELTPKIELPAAFRERLEQQIEGMAQLAYFQELDELFFDILYWVRDRHLLQETNDPTYLYHSDHPDRLPVPPLEQVEQWISDAKLATARSTKITTCLEALFLKLATT